MRTTNISLIKKLANLKILEKKELTNDYQPTEDDIIIADATTGTKYKIVTDTVSDEDLPLVIMTEQLATMKSIKNMVLFFVILAVIGIIAMFCFGISITDTFDSVENFSSFY